MLKLGNMFKHVFSQLKDTLSCLSLKMSLSWVEGHLASSYGEWGDNPKRGKEPSSPLGAISKWQPSSCYYLMALERWCKLLELWPRCGRGGTPNSREVSPLLSPTSRGGAWARRGDAILRGELSLLQETHLLPLAYINICLLVKCMLMRVTFIWK